MPEENIYQQQFVPRQTYIGTQQFVPEQLKDIYRKNGEQYWKEIKEQYDQQKALKELEGFVRTASPSTYVGLAIDKMQDKPYGTTYEETPEVFKDVIDLTSPALAVKGVKAFKPTLSLVKKNTKNYIGNALQNTVEKHPQYFGVNYLVDPNVQKISKTSTGIKKIDENSKLGKYIIKGIYTVPPVSLVSALVGINAYEHLAYPWKYPWADTYYRSVVPQVKRYTNIDLPNFVDERYEKEYLKSLQNYDERFPNRYKIKTDEDFYDRTDDHNFILKDVTNKLINLNQNPDSLNYAPAFNDFEEENKKQGTFRKKKDYTDDDLLTDRNIPISKFNNWYSIKNGNVIYGPRESFDEEDYISPNRISLTDDSIKIKDIDGDLVYFNSDNEPQYNLLHKNIKYLLHSPSSKHTLFFKQKGEEAGLKSLKRALKKYPDLTPILLDAGRYNYSAKPNHDVTIDDYIRRGFGPNDLPVFGIKY